MPVTTNNFESVGDSILSENGYLPVAEIDAGPWKSLSYTLHNLGDVDSAGDQILDSAGAPTGNSLKWTVFGANAEDFSDEVIVQVEATVLLDGHASYAVTQAVYRYYRVKVKSASGGQEATANVRGMAKQ